MLVLNTVCEIREIPFNVNILNRAYPYVSYNDSYLYNLFKDYVNFIVCDNAYIENKNIISLSVFDLFSFNRAIAKLSERYYFVKDMRSFQFVQNRITLVCIEDSVCYSVVNEYLRKQSIDNILKELC